jgi:septum site-determining protein MinC
MLKKENYVILKGRHKGIDIQLDKTADFPLIEAALRDKITGARDFFAGANTNIAFKGRELTAEQEKQLLDIILKETTLDVSFVEGEGYLPPPQAVRRPSTSAAPPAHAHHMEQNTTFYRQGLRSGQSIRFEGSVVIMGDVNPGSEVVAHGNVIILGALKGMVHAGVMGDNTCFVSAFYMQPTQLRIAGVITYIPPNEADARKGKKVFKPEWAYIKEGQIFIAPLTN